MSTQEFSRTLRTDGRGNSITIDRNDAVIRHRFVCPNGHTSWRKTNSHIYCDSCQQAHYHILDKKSGERILWDNVRLVNRLSSKLAH